MKEYEKNKASNDNIAFDEFLLIKSDLPFHEKLKNTVWNTL